MNLHSVPWRNDSTFRVTSFNSEEFLYTPTKQIETLLHKTRLTENTNPIEIIFEDNDNTSIIMFSKGRNKGITTKLSNKSLGEQLCDLNTPYCVYVPGIAGIPISEIYEPEIKVRKSAVRGDGSVNLNV